MGLLNQLEKGNMGAQSLDGKTPVAYNSTNPNEAKSVEGLKENAGLDPVGLEAQTELSYPTPKKYTDNLPE